MDDSSHMSAFDRYLDAMLAGRDVTPEDFAEDGKIDGAMERLQLLLSGISTSETMAAMPVSDDLTISSVGEFRLLRKLGQGGMGIVYLAEQTSLGRLVALKVLPPRRANSPIALERFRREAKAAAKLRHRNIVRLLEFGEADGVQYIAMDFVPGRSLQELLASEEDEAAVISTTSILRWGVELAEALDAAHQRGIIHRDVKPGNILIDKDGRALLLDFGLAKCLIERQVTLTLTFAGSPGYAAPEQLGAFGGRVDQRADLYGLGVTLYEAFTGQPVFEAQSLSSLSQSILNNEPVPPSVLVPGLPIEIDIVLNKCMNKEPGLRYQSAKELGADLNRILEYRPILARAPNPWDRFTKWRKRNRILANSVFVIVFVIACSFSWQVARSRRRIAAKKEKASTLVRQAARVLSHYDQQRMPFETRKWRLLILNKKLNREQLTLEELAERDELTNRLDEEQRDRGLALAKAADVLSRAKELDENSVVIANTFASLYHQQWLDRRGKRQAPLGRYYRKLALQNGKDKSWIRKLASASPVTIKSEPPGADIYLFRSIEQSRLGEIWPKCSWDQSAWEKRIVPAPMQKEIPQVMPGTFCWRVSQDVGNLRGHDLILAGDRSTAPKAKDICRVWRLGTWLDLEIPDNAVFVQTSTPLLVSSKNHLGVTPFSEQLIEAGEYVAVLRKAGFEDVILSFHVDFLEDPYHRHGDADMTVSMWPQGQTDQDFVRVTSEVYQGDALSSFSMMRHEVTNSDYWYFLNDQVIRDEIAKSSQKIYVPRGQAGGETWRGNPKDGYGFRKKRAQFPVVGISQIDAKRYATWRGDHDKDSRTYSLPTRGEWFRATCGGESRKYSFGNYFHPLWLQSRFSQSRVVLEDVMAYWRDQSPFGAFDMAGGVAEWGQAEGQSAPVLGGSHWDSHSGSFLNVAVRDMSTSEIHDWVGFRLVCRTKKKD